MFVAAGGRAAAGQVYGRAAVVFKSHSNGLPYQGYAVAPPSQTSMVGTCPLLEGPDSSDDRVLAWFGGFGLLPSASVYTISWAFT